MFGHHTSISSALLKRGACRTVLPVCLLAELIGCKSKPSEKIPASTTIFADASRATTAAAIKPASIFPDGTRSLLLLKSVSVRLEPADDGKRIGTIAIDTRVAWTTTKVGSGCAKPWVQLDTVGGTAWICSEFVQPTDKPPHGQEVPYLDRDEWVPGVYGKIVAAGAVLYEFDEPAKRKPPKPKPIDKLKNKPGAGKNSKDVTPSAAKDRKKDDRPVTSTRDMDRAINIESKPVAPVVNQSPRMISLRPVVGSVNVRRYGELNFGGRPYWKISEKNEYVLKSAISQHVPSLYAGTRLGDDTGLTLPIAFVWPKGGGASVSARHKSVGGGTTRQLSKRTAVAILESFVDAKAVTSAYRIGPSPESEWVDASAVKLFTPAPPPPGLLPQERWIDIDLDQQILVAYEGDVAVYATMITSGTALTPSTPGVYRMWKKVSETDMNGLNGEDPYSVATVPWTQFFSPEDGLAIHTSYWHDNFGTQRSHGCINAAPRDARWLYFWSDPQMPPGWSMSAGVVEAPGSIVRVRTAVEPNPPERGYAKKVLEARLSTAPR
jgi:hypothetical protein